VQLSTLQAAQAKPSEDPQLQLLQRRLDGLQRALDDASRKSTLLYDRLVIEADRAAHLAEAHQTAIQALRQREATLEEQQNRLRHCEAALAAETLQRQRCEDALENALRRERGTAQELQLDVRAQADRAEIARHDVSVHYQRAEAAEAEVRRLRSVVEGLEQRLRDAFTLQHRYVMKLSLRSSHHCIVSYCYLS